MHVIFLCMHFVEPYFNWRAYYIANEDSLSPFFAREYSEFEFTNKVYNFLLHPQWDNFGSPTLFLKILYVDYSENIAVIEFIGEWNDAIENDIMNLKKEIIDPQIKVFEKMLNVGVPEQAVRLKMRSQGLDDSLLDSFILTKKM